MSWGEWERVRERERGIFAAVGWRFLGRDPTIFLVGELVPIAVEEAVGLKH